MCGTAVRCKLKITFAAVTAQLLFLSSADPLSEPITVRNHLEHRCKAI